MCLGRLKDREPKVCVHPCIYSGARGGVFNAFVVRSLDFHNGTGRGMGDPGVSSLLNGYEFITFIQSAQNPILDWIAMGASSLGHEAFFIVFVPVYYWCIDKRHGVRLALVFLFSAYINGLAKETFRIPRPDPLFVRVLWPSSGGGYSFPSGHAQNAMIFWGWLGRRKPWRKVPWLLALLVLTISLSRIYLGLHFLQDVLGGWILGGVLLVMLVAIDRRISREPRNWAGRLLPWSGVVLPFFMLLFSSCHFHPMISGAILGFTLGYILESRWVGFSSKGPLGYQISKLVLGGGLGGTLATFLKFTLPNTPEGDFVHFGIMGLWVSLGLPFLSHRLWGRKEVSCGEP